MKRFIVIQSLLIIISLNIATVSAQFRQKEVRLKAEEFHLSDVRLLNSPFKRAMQLDAEVLLKIKPDRLLHNFRENVWKEKGLTLKQDTKFPDGDRITLSFDKIRTSKMAPKIPAKTVGPYKNAIRFGLSGVFSSRKVKGNRISTLSPFFQWRSITI